MEDKKYYSKSFPLLTDFYLYPNTESTYYNCISYTLGISDYIIWPTIQEKFYWKGIYEVTFNSFDFFYKEYGFERCNLLDISYSSDYIKVALFIKNGLPCHASLQKDNFWWESKIGELGIIKHDLFEIEGDTYGEVKYIYKKKRDINESLLNFEDFLKKL